MVALQREGGDGSRSGARQCALGPTRRTRVVTRGRCETGRREADELQVRVQRGEALRLRRVLHVLDDAPQLLDVLLLL